MSEAWDSEAALQVSTEGRTRQNSFGTKLHATLNRFCLNELLGSYNMISILGHKSRKNYEIHIDVSHSRQPLVKGERLVRYEVNTVMLLHALGQNVLAPTLLMPPPMSF